VSCENHSEKSDERETKQTNRKSVHLIVKILGDNKFDSDKDNILVVVIATEYDFTLITSKSQIYNTACYMSRIIFWEISRVCAFSSFISET